MLERLRNDYAELTALIEATRQDALDQQFVAENASRSASWKLEQVATLQAERDRIGTVLEAMERLRVPRIENVA